MDTFPHTTMGSDSIQLELWGRAQGWYVAVLCNNIEISLNLLSPSLPPSLSLSLSLALPLPLSCSQYYFMLM